MGINMIVIEGNLADDCESREVGGKQKTKATVIWSTKWKDEEFVTPIEFQLWGKQAEAFAPRLKKGTHVSVQGELRQDTWEGKDGKRNYRLYIRTNNISVVERKKTEPTVSDADDGGIPF